MRNSCCMPMMWWPRQFSRMMMEAACRPRYTHYQEPAAYRPAPARRDIIDTALAAGSFTSLVSAVISAGLGETLKGAGSFTVFAPKDEAFATLPQGVLEELLQPANKSRLQELLGYHVIPESITAADLVTRKSVKTLNGKELPVNVSFGAINAGQLRGSLRAGNALVTQADIDCTNGTIHVIDHVLTMPAE